MIGAGFSGLAAATVLADAGHEITIYEKNDSPGGRARKFHAKGFTFDMGPSWYWMPDVFESYFSRFGKKVSDYYDLRRLDPSYRVYYGKNDFIDLPASLEKLFMLFESLEEGSSNKLENFLKQAKYKYEAGMKEFVWKPGNSLTEFLDPRILSSALKLQMFSSISSEIRSLFKNEKILKLLEFPVLFLGATPQNTPALYSLMNYADFSLGTWYPMGGMHNIIDAMVQLAEEKGVQFIYNQSIENIKLNNNQITNIGNNDSTYEVDYVISSGDYHHFEQNILPEEKRRYSASYWDKRTMAPSSLIFYLGIDKKVENLQHHNLFFDKDFEKHADEIYTNPCWPTEPLFYVCCPSIIDKTVAPAGKENLFILLPLAPALKDTENLREEYFKKILMRLNAVAGIDIKSHIEYKRSYCVNDFEKDYFAYKGNAYGLANTLRQTAFLKPKIKSNKIKNLFYTGQLTTPGPGVPPSLISGQVVAQELLKTI